MNPDFKKLFESAPGLFLALSPELNIVAVSDAYLSATKTERGKIVGKGIFDIFPDNPNDPAATGVSNLHSSLLRVVKTKIPDTMAVQKYDIRLPESEGGGFEEKFWSPINSPVLNHLGELEYVIHRVEDVTEFIQLRRHGSLQSKENEELKSKAAQMESEIYERAQQIQETNKKLREAEKIKSDFFANVSHELRTPLSLIIAPLEGLLSSSATNLTPKQRTELNTAYNNAVRLLQLVNGLLDFTKLQAGKLKPNLKPTDVFALTRIVLGDFESLVDKKKIHLVEDIAEVRNAILTDAYLFERILFNLLSNAVKFTPEGGYVTVTLKQDGDTTVLSVTDTGIGIPADEIEKLFKKFYQVESSSARRFEGTGLGLAMVKEFAGLLEGDVSVESEPGNGSTFTVRLKSEQTNMPATALNLNIPHKEMPNVESVLPVAIADYQSKHMMRVLVCEDNKELSDYIEHLLNEFAEVRTAPNGRIGLNTVNDWKPDLVLTDVMMPEMDGIELCTKIKSNSITSDIIVVLLTALTHREAMMRGWEAKADEYLFKPFHPDELKTRIKTLLTVIADKKRTMDQLRETNELLMRKNDELEAFTYSVTHDLRAPLRAISGFSGLLVKQKYLASNAEAAAITDKIGGSIRKMQSLVDDLLNLSKISKVEFKTDLVNTDKLVSEIIEDLKKIPGTKTTFIREPLESVYGDAGLLSQLFLNLIGNAVKYSAKQAEPHVTIKSERKKNNIMFSISDNGVGFDMAYADKLFKPFQRLHGESEFTGSGIGLSIVKRIVDRHRGKVWVEAEVDKGATFYVSIPVKEH